MASFIPTQLVRSIPHPLLQRIQKLQSLAPALALTAPYSAKARSVIQTILPHSIIVKRQAIRDLHITHCLQASQPSTLRPSAPTPLSNEEYHKLADKYIENLVELLENLQDERAEVDCEYSAGVLNLDFPPAGKYVINKQPPNKQIWLSSPVSGPKRYDYVEGQWVYLRDGGLLTVLLEEELGIKIGEEPGV